MEVTGLAVGVIALAGLFNNAVDCFEYVQLGHDFEQNYTTCRIQLDCARLQLSRWGQSVGIGKDLQDQGALKVAASKEEVQEAQELLTQILELFKRARDTADKYNTRAKRKGQELVLYDAEENRDAPASKLHEAMRRLSLSRQGMKNLAKKAKWALHEENRFRTLLGDIKSLVGELVELFPAATPVQLQLVDTEVKEFGDNEALPLLKSVAQDQDKMLAARLEQAMAKSTTSYNISFANSTNHGMQIGHASGPVYSGSRV